jgi:LacI family transcriptional regulator
VNEKNLKEESTLTIKDIGRLAKVSPATVSLVLNEKPGVSAETRDRVLKIVSLLNYKPNYVARSLVKGRCYAIAMLITSPLNPIFPELAAGIGAVLKKQGYSLSIISTYDNEEVITSEIQKIRSRGIDGIITSAALLKDDGLVTLAKSGYPVISVLRRLYDCEELDFVCVDNLKGGYLAMEHLIRLGHKRIGIIKGPQNTSTGKERYEGALIAFDHYRISFTHDLIAQGDYFKESGYRAAKKMLSKPLKNRPTAIYAANDEMAFGAFNAIWDLGIKVPEEVALVGFNDVEATALRGIEITTISQRKKEMGRLAAKRLINKIEKNRGYNKPYQVLLEPKLTTRKSCGYSLSSNYVVRRTSKRYPQSN